MADVARRIYHRRWRRMRELRSAVRTGTLILSMTAKSEAPAAALGSRQLQRTRTNREKPVWLHLRSKDLFFRLISVNNLAVRASARVGRKKDFAGALAGRALVRWPTRRELVREADGVDVLDLHAIRGEPRAARWSALCGVARKKEVQLRN